MKMNAQTFTAVFTSSFRLDPFIIAFRGGVAKW